MRQNWNFSWCCSHIWRWSLLSVPINLCVCSQKYLEDAEFLLADLRMGGINWSNFVSGNCALESFFWQWRKCAGIERRAGSWIVLKCIRLSGLSTYKYTLRLAQYILCMLPGWEQGPEGRRSRGWWDLQEKKRKRKEEMRDRERNNMN